MRYLLAIAPRMLLAMVGLALAMQSSDGRSQVTVQSAPTLPIAGRPFTYYLKVVTVGAPLTITNTTASVHESMIDLSFCLIQGSSSTAPATKSFSIDAPAMAAGQYIVRVFVQGPAESGANCQNNAHVLTTNSLIVELSAVKRIVEYYNLPGNHYFQTASPEEKAILDAGLVPGWQRTGQEYVGYAAEELMNSAKIVPVCRYYGKPSYGLDTHFFSAFAQECTLVPILFPDQWILETDRAYAMAIPDSATGNCAPGTNDVYRLFNGKAAVNHRYTTSQQIRQEMINEGWISEGYGMLGVGMCAEQIN